jgi:hypothetical protein
MSHDKSKSRVMTSSGGSLEQPSKKVFNLDSGMCQNSPGLGLFPEPHVPRHGQQPKPVVQDQMTLDASSG